MEKMSDTKLTLVDHVYLTYRSLRVALVITCFGIPIGLIIVGYITNIRIQESLSDYYYAEFPPMLLRAIFIGLLFLLGGLLVAYRGFTKGDNWIHNLAGVFAWGVAIFPMKCPHLERPLSELCYSLGPGWIHYTSAMLLFVMSIVSITYNGGKRFKTICEKYIKDKIRSFKIARSISGIIVSCGIFSALVMLGIGGIQLFRKLVWIPESLGFVGFGAYWGFLTYYISVANRRAEKKKKEKKLDVKGILVAPTEELYERPTRAIP
jgi:hypothetical protein